MKRFLTAKPDCHIGVHHIRLIVKRFPLSFLKKCLSYVYEFHVETTSSLHTEFLSVTYRKGRYVLNTANAIYSFEDLYTNFRDTFEQLEIANQGFKKVLVLGLGLGSIPMMLEKIFQCKFVYTAVELDEEVVYLAEKYSLNRLESPIEVVVADAETFVRSCDEQFDLIAMDVFLDDEVPYQFERHSFLEHLSELIAPGGLLLYNRLSCTEMDLKNTQQFYELDFKSFFPDATYIDTSGNWILMSRPVV